MGRLRTFAILFILSVMAVLCTRHKCRRGHLTSENTCENERSPLLYLGLGPDSHFAKGKVDKSYCEPIKSTKETGTLQGFGSVTTQFKKVSCDPYLPSFQGICIYGQKGNDVAFVAIDEACDRGVFFNGHNRTLSKGEIVPLTLPSPDFLFVFFTCWAVVSLVGLLGLFTIAIRERSLTPDDLPPKLRKLVGLVVFSPGPFLIAYSFSTGEMANLSFRAWAGITISTCLFLLILFASTYASRLVFDRRLKEKMKEKI